MLLAGSILSLIIFIIYCEYFKSFDWLRADGDIVISASCAQI